MQVVELLPAGRGGLDDAASAMRCADRVSVPTDRRTARLVVSHAAARLSTVATTTTVLSTTRSWLEMNISTMTATTEATIDATAAATTTASWDATDPRRFQRSTTSASTVTRAVHTAVVRTISPTSRTPSMPSGIRVIARLLAA